ANEQFLLRKKAENMLYEAYPKEIVSKYSMVTYHPEIPYAEAYRKGKILENILHKIFTEIDTIEEFDLEEARRKILFEYNNSTA
ncbi:MAG: hypothetical protein OEZ01_08675, partial [Candidatus Heimdallarchaeota archaeon]|nr:hypothetical protein [Candidatus Heimdallarchaeota archaeon]